MTIRSPWPRGAGGHREMEQAALRAPRDGGGNRFGFARRPGQTHDRARGTRDKPALVQARGPGATIPCTGPIFMGSGCRKCGMMTHGAKSVTSLMAAPRFADRIRSEDFATRETPP